VLSARKGRGYSMKKIFAKIVDVKPEEIRALLLAFSTLSF